MWDVAGFRVEGEDFSLVVEPPADPGFQAALGIVSEEPGEFDGAFAQLDVEITLRMYLTLGVLLGVAHPGIDAHETYQGAGEGFRVEVASASGRGALAAVSLEQYGPGRLVRVCVLLGGEDTRRVYDTLGVLLGLGS